MMLESEISKCFKLTQEKMDMVAMHEQAFQKQDDQRHKKVLVR